MTPGVNRTFRLAADGTAITGVISSIQGGIQVAFKKR